MRRAFVVLALASCSGLATAPPPATPPPTTTATAAPTPAATATPIPAPIARAHTVDVDGHPIAVWQKSPGTPARGSLVLVHGRTWSGRPDFDLSVPGESRSFMDAMVAEGWSTWAVDLRGYGGTPRDESGFITPDRAVADLAEVMRWVAAHDDVPDEPAALGWSLGSLVVQLLAQRHPELVSDAILYGYPRDPDAVGRGAADPKGDPPRKPTTDAAAAEDFIVPGAISQQAIAAFVAAARKADPVRADWRGGAQWSALDPKRVDVPVLVIHGEADPYAPVAAQAKLFTRLQHPDRAWVIVAGGDHAAHLENCGPRFVHAVVSFLERDQATRASRSAASAGHGW